MSRFIQIILCTTIIFSGCTSIKDFGSSLKYTVQGEYYLQGKNYEKGRETFLQSVRNDPYNPEAHFFYGRFLLAENNAKEALPALRKAVDLYPQKSEYHFWLGVTYGELGQSKKEQNSYKEALQLDKNNLSALIYLGNNLLRTKQYTKALVYYEKALAIWQYSPQPLYNRAVILRKLNRTPEEKLAWLHYLDAYPSGSFAQTAADRLNSLGDQSYRNHKLGARTITLEQIKFVPFSSQLEKSSLPSLDIIGASVSNMPKGILNIVTYQLNNLKLAKKRSLSIRNYLGKKYPDLMAQHRIKASWFDVAERQSILGKTLLLDESVRFFLTKPK